jgi:hypothetical protein
MHFVFSMDADPDLNPHGSALIYPGLHQSEKLDRIRIQSRIKVIKF